MNETPQEYSRRMTALIAGKQPLNVQAATPGNLAQAIKGQSAARLRRRPAPGKWSVNEVVAHLADSEIVLGYRLRLILSVPGSPLTAVDQDSWVATGHYDKRDPRKSVELFRVLRDTNLALIRSLTPGQWKHFGMHSERGRETIKDIVRLYAGHDINHLQQIERILGG
jgi:DinB superfamily